MKNHTVARSAGLYVYGSQRGAAAVEFAIVSSLLLLLVFGIIDFSILLYNKAVITNASREGARAGIVFASDRNQTSVENRVTDAINPYTEHLINFGADPSVSQMVSIEGGWTTVEAGQVLTVSLTYSHNFLVFPNLSRLFGGNSSPSLDLQSQTVMRME